MQTRVTDGRQRPVLCALQGTGQSDSIKAEGKVLVRDSRRFKQEIQERDSRKRFKKEIQEGDYSLVAIISKMRWTCISSTVTFTKLTTKP